MRRIQHGFGNISSTPKLIDQSDVAPRNTSCQILYSDQSRITAAISGSDIRNIMLEAVVPRFKTLRAAATSKMLIQQWAALIANETPIFSRQIGRSLASRRSAVRRETASLAQFSSNQWLKKLAILETFKGYVPVTPLLNITTILGSIERCVQDYNDRYRYLGLKCPRFVSSLQLKQQPPEYQVNRSKST
ncbi:hypothetical protein [Paracoccus aerius]|uniref:Uncharacterized protein n=1 Tax=Paracoccus aerius TaxID=1915382 RepID=A0ABS1SB20_9RHOB|nr:hypothetical protein [Paracoccus aerius]MBL3675735.1 hypothetical protein [Paracoccus aerius]